jgi:hypothetical protein
MHIPKNYFQDRLVLLLLSVNAFLALLGSVLVLLRLDNSRSVYVLQYRSNLGLDSAFRSGPSSSFVSFIAFALAVLIFHTLLSMRVYHVRRHFSVAILGLALLLLGIALIVSNALLEL